MPRRKGPRILPSRHPLLSEGDHPCVDFNFIIIITLGKMHGLVVSALLLVTVGANPFLTPTFLQKKNQFFDIVRDQGRAMSSKGFVFPPDQWFNQTLDHYNALNQGFWPQRYWVNESFYAGNGPLFLYVEGEGSGSPIDVVLGQHVELAAQHGALIISLEHRCVNEWDLGVPVLAISHACLDAAFTARVSQLLINRRSLSQFSLRTSQLATSPYLSTSM